MGKISNELLGFFLEEASEHLATLENGLLQLEKDPDDRSVLDELFRSAHTIKGSAALVKLTETSAVAHRLEDTLEALRDGSATSSHQKVDAMLFALDKIKELVSLAASGEDEPEGVLEEVRNALEGADLQAPARSAESAGSLTGDLSLTEPSDGEQAGSEVSVPEGGYPAPQAELPDVHAMEPGETGPTETLPDPGFEDVPEAVQVAEGEPGAVAEAYPVLQEDVSEAGDDMLAEALPVAEDDETELLATAEPETGTIGGQQAREEEGPDTAEEEEKARVTPDSEESFSAERRMPGRRKTDINLAAGGVIKLNSLKLDGMMNVLGEITIRKNHLMNQLAFVERLREEIEFAGERLLKEVNSFSERYAYSLPEQVKFKDALLSEFMDLEFDRYDELNLFSRKLQEITNDVNEGFRSLGNFFLDVGLNATAMERMITDMKERISDARMIEAGMLFQRFTRTVRDLSRQTGKDIRFLVAGGDTPLDRVVFDGLFDPLLHIIRNAVAHGFESPEERKRAGKPATGTIRLAAKREGNTVVIDIRDDGRGIQFDKVRERAIARGLLAPGQAAGPKELLRYLFAPGFSTADSTDETSGRGVGLDVVKDRLASLNGTVSILTKKGRGTVFRLRLPLSLVIINVIHFRVANLDFVIPSNLIMEITDIVRPPEEEKKVKVREESLDAVNLHGIFGIPVDASTKTCFAIITQVSGARVALIVDEIVAQEDTVIRPFGSFLKEMRYYSGTSTSGDGRLRLVINPAWLAECSERREVDLDGDAFKEPEKPKLLVVDDSLSVRKIASLFLQANGFEVLTASNGMEALDVLVDQPEVRFILTDLEMPVMHGYELLAELQRRGFIGRIPVVVLTSRGGEQHKKKAFDLGASDYLVKPFEETSLIETVRKYVHEQQRV